MVMKAGWPLAIASSACGVVLRRRHAQRLEHFGPGDAAGVVATPCTSTGTPSRASSRASSGVRLAILRAPL